MGPKASDISIVRTTRNSAFPLIIRAYASPAFACLRDLRHSNASPIMDCFSFRDRRTDPQLRPGAARRSAPALCALHVDLDAAEALLLHQWSACGSSDGRLRV